MDLNDLKIKQLIRTLKNPAENFPEVLEELKKETGLYVYSFPAMAYRKDRDTCSDFYLYLTERLEKVLACYPCNADIRFKTWFNYVLRNQFHNFSCYRGRNEIRCVSLDEEGGDYPDGRALLEEEEARYGDLENGLGKIGEWDRALIRFFYMPGTVRGDDVRLIVRLTGSTVKTVLDVLREMVTAQKEDLERKRETSDKTGLINRKLTELKYKLVRYRGRELSDEELARMNELLGKIARLESSRARLLRNLKMPDRKVTAVFSKLFGDRPGAVRRLDLARNKLRFEMMKLKKKNEKAG